MFVENILRSEILLPTDQDNPDLSIVIISYNTLEMTQDCLSSVYENTGELKLQVIVVDNDSKDGSAEMVRKKFPQVTLIANENNLGFATANNQGFRLASGEYVLLLNSDTVILGDVLVRSVEYMRTHPNVGAMGCRVLNTDLTMQATCSGYPTLGRLSLMASGLDRLSVFQAYDRYMLRGWQRDTERDVEVISGCYLLVKRVVIDTVGGLDEDFFFFGEETDWCLHIHKAGWQLKFAPVGEIIHHGGGSVNKLNYRRDIMLSEATIRLHLKNGGLLNGIIAFMIICIFVFTHAAGWSFISITLGNGHDRARHFRDVASHISDIWPK